MKLGEERRIYEIEPEDTPLFLPEEEPAEAEPVSVPEEEPVPA